MPVADSVGTMARLPSSPLDRTAADAAGTGSQATVVPLVAESLEVATTARQVGALRVRIVVDDSHDRIGTDLVRDEYQPTLRPVGVPASERLDPYQDGDELVIPLYEERLVVEKRLFLKEEVRLRRVRHVEPGQRDERVRRERAIVERQQPDGTWREVAADPGAPVAEHASSSPGRSALE